MSKTSIIWFRQDLRHSDNPALNKAIENSDNVIALYILDEESEGIRPLGGASKWFLHQSLKSLQKNLKQEYGIELIFKKGKSISVLEDIASESKAQNIYWNRLYEPYHIKRDKQIKDKLKAKHNVESFNASLLVEPWEIKNQTGGVYKVYTPFYKACLKENNPRSTIKPPEKSSKKYDGNLNSFKLDDLNLIPTKPDWSKKFHRYWQVSESDAHNMLYDFLENKVDKYGEMRNFPAQDYTSKLSPYLHFGLISPNQIYFASTYAKQKSSSQTQKEIDKFISEIYWREFSYNLIYNFPEIPDNNFKKEFDDFPWSEYIAENLEKWQNGQTGYPIVDAGMRELYETGWMHNRVRMIVGSFLTKHLLIHWKHGEEWFWDCLFDADLANNVSGWQWVSGCGADAAPYFRVFNPITQGQKFDPEGNYVRKWVPEISKLHKKHIQNPWEAPPEILSELDINLGKTYPKPMIDHKYGRERALKSYEKIKKN